MRWKIIVVAVALLILISGCSLLKKRPDVKTDVLGGDVYTGTNGLDISFLKELPPARVYDNGEMHIVAELRNKGTKEATGTLFLSGLDQSIVQGIDIEKEFNNIEPRSKFFDEGGIQTIDFISRDIRLPSGTDSYKPTVVLTACYTYETKANPVVCVDPNRQNIITDRNKVCTPRRVSFGGGQGAPVAVTAVDIQSTSDEVYAKIEIKNLGQGKVVDRGGTLSRCPYSLKYEDLNKIKLSTNKITLSGRTPKRCSPDININAVILSDERATITCIFDIPRDQQFAYETPLHMELDYGYMQSVSKQVEIIHVG